MIKKDILKRAIQLWGAEAQKEMIIEECLELAVALQKNKRSDIAKGSEDRKKEQIFKIEDEIADVKIMIAQAEMIFDRNNINQRIRYKMNRLEKRVKRAEAWTTGGDEVCMLSKEEFDKAYKEVQEWHKNNSKEDSNADTN